MQSIGNLWAGMHSDDRKASFLFRTDPYAHDPTLQSVASPYDGDMVELFKKWGYNEDKADNAKIDKECDFDEYHKIKRAFDELGIKTQSKANGGPNQCFQIDHENGPNVIRDKDGNLPPRKEQRYIDASCGKEYAVSVRHNTWWHLLISTQGDRRNLPIWRQRPRWYGNVNECNQCQLQCEKDVGAST
jgi:hypothetical protein